MISPKTTYHLSSNEPRLVLREDGIEGGFIGRLQGLKKRLVRNETIPQL